MNFYNEYIAQTLVIDKENAIFNHAIIHVASLSARSYISRGFGA